jgi:hypothetical protein
MTCPIAIVPHHITAAERESHRREAQADADVVVPTF